MTIRVLNNANEEISKQIREVELICKKYDKTNGNITLDTSLNFDQKMKSLFLFYGHNKLVSVLSLFMPTAGEAEVSAYTLPGYRKNKFFKELLNKAVKELKKYEQADLLFVCEPQSKDGVSAIRKLGAELDFTEYFLRFKGPLIKQQSPQIKLQEAGLEDLGTIVALSQQIFNDEYGDAKSIIGKSLESENRTQYIVFLNGKPVGMGAVSFESKEASIFGIGILPQYQGKGFGKELLHLILSDLKKKDIQGITIEVDSNNANAFHLYVKCGFEVITSYDYYRMRTPAISS